MPGKSYRSPLLTDLYELTMAAAYFEKQWAPERIASARRRRWIRVTVI